MRWGYQKAQLTDYARTFDTSIILMSHSHWFWRIIGTLAFWLPAGRFAQTIGPLVGIPDEWTVAQAKDVIPHEAAHVKQARWCGLWIHPWVGLVPFGILYLLVPIPVLGAWFRYRFELHADTQRWRAHLSTGAMGPEDVLLRAKRFAETVAGRSYVWPWPAGFVRRGFLAAAARVIREHHATR